MPIQTACPNCAKPYNLADAMKGKNVKCKNCANVFLVEPVAAKPPTPAPKTAKPVATTTAPVKAKAAPKKTAPQPVEEDDDIVDVVAVNDDEDDEVDDRPARNRSKRSADLDQPRKKSGGMLWLLVAGGGGVALLLLLGCGGGLWYVMSGGVNNAITEANFDKLRMGMSEAEVQAVLGTPTQILDLQNPFGFGGNPLAPNAPNAPNIKSFIWERGGNTITVTFANGKSSMIVGEFKTRTGTITRVGTGNGVAQGPPNNPPPNNPPPNNPPPPVLGGNPSKMTEMGAFMLGPGTDKNSITFFTKDDPPTNKTVANVVAPNGRASAEHWTWINGNGYLKIYFDQNGAVVDREHKGLPK